MLTTDLAMEVVRALSRIVSGPLMTEEQFRGITGSVVGKYFADWFPASQQELEAERRVEVARTHIAEATRIIDGLRSDLDHQVFSDATSAAAAGVPAESGAAWASI